MTQPIPSQSDDISAVIQRVHHLGMATENLFSRLYQSLTSKNKQAKRQAAVAEITEQVQQMARRNRRLRQMIDSRDIEVERLHGILTHISEGIIMQDNEGRIIMMNDTARILLGNQRNFWTSELGVLFNHHRTMEPIGSELALLGEPKRVQIEDRVLGAQICAVKDSHGERIGTVMILRDVTQDALAARMKDSFVTHISHELITPLAPMRVASEILLNTPEGKTPNRKMLTMIGRNIDILDRMVREMLDMSAMTSGNFSVKQNTLLLEDLIWNVVNDFSGDIKDAKLDITVMLRDTEALEIKGDDKHLTWAIGNLVRNATQYSEPDNHIVIMAGINRSNPQEITIKVVDTGVGISDEDLPNIFNLFYRGEARTESGKKLDPRGLGQGLFVAKTVVEAHGGSLSVESQHHQGSTFTLSLPRHQQLTLPA
ncbi:MAG: PAS domain-containing sensor histidine kinase [Anaerolineae bacterium]|nr:PAS domain-containing sensor histidine kinase [Anaerolineae bacterium]